MIDVSDSDDDDIEVLEQKLANARHNDYGRAKERVYIDSHPQDIKCISFVDIDLSDEEEGSRAPSDIERELCPTGQKWTPSPKKKTPTPKKKNP